MADPYSFWPYSSPGEPMPMAPPPMNIHPGVARSSEPARPLSPSDFHESGVPSQVPPLPRQWGRPEAQASAPLSPREMAVMRGMLNILKQGREAMASGMLDGMELQRLTAAHAYLSGFFEARGLGELGTFLQAIPPVGSSKRDPRLAATPHSSNASSYSLNPAGTPR